MALRWFLAIALLSSLLLPVTAAKAQTLDQYGGYTSLPVPGGATGSFRAGKIGNRWVLATPNGNAFWMRGVYAVTGGDSVDEQGSTYNARFLQKYGSAAVGWNQANRRLLSWGFNTIGPFSYRMVLPVDPENVVKMPFVGLAPNPSISGRFSGANKNLYAGLDATVSVFANSRGGNFPDVYDPAWQQYVTSSYATDSNLAAYKTSPYFIGYFSDDTDFLAGFGPGVDFPTDPAGKYHWHLGYLVLITASTQVANPYSTPVNQAYANPTVYSKLALRDFLVSRYGTIAALNSAWGATYTTFDSDGGWPSGRGLLDENGRLTHSWLGSQNPWLLTGMTPQVKADLDDFLFELAKKFFSVNRTAFKAVAPNALFFGPTNLGGAGWRAPTRGPVLKAAGQYLDVVNIGSDGSQAQLDFVASWAGDVPVAIWEGVTANADSGRWRYSAESGTTWDMTSQALRGQKYQQDVQALLTRVAAPTGSIPFVGLLWWAWGDSSSEQRNWGLVSLRDNAYNGREAIRAAGSDPWGYPTGGEERDYGSFLDAAIAANAGVGTTLNAGGAGGGTTSTSVSITAPSSGSAVSSSVTVAAEASSTATRIDLLLDGKLMGMVGGTSARYLWDTTTSSNGTHRWVAWASDTSSAVVSSAPVDVLVANTTTSGDTTPPSVAITQPLNGDAVGRKTRTQITAMATDNVGVARVEFYVGGSLQCSVTAAPYSCTWQVPAAPGKSYNLQAKAYDAKGNASQSSIVRVTAR
jgi:hypothetical protein